MLVVPGMRWPEKSVSSGLPCTKYGCCCASAHRSGASPPSPLNSGVTTPTTTAVLPFSRMSLPTIPGSAPKRLVQKRWCSTTIGGLPGASSSTVKIRPSSGVAPSSARKFPVTK